MMKRPVNPGFSLVETMVAVLILGLGATAVASLATTMTRSNGFVDAHTEAAALASRVISEVHDARLVPGAADPGLVSGGGLAVGHVTAPIAGSSIQSIGTFGKGGGAGGTLTVDYEVLDCTVCQNPFGGVAGASLGGVDVLVTVDNGPGQNALLRPYRVIVRKEFSVPADAAVRGW